MSSLLPEVEGWVKIAGAAVAVLMALLVPVRSWIVEDRRYRAEARDVAATAASAATAGITTGAHVLADSLALGAIAEGLREVAAAIRFQAESERFRDRDRLTRVLDRLLEQAGAENEVHPLSEPANPAATSRCSPPARSPG